MRYGEIAHIENVLKGEIRERKHLTNSYKMETSSSTETEETSEKTEKGSNYH